MIFDQKQDAVDAIRQSYRLLSREQDLSPANERITHSLTRLVRTLTKCLSPELTSFLLTTPELATEREQLPLLCGKAECEMEKYWARRLLSRPVCDLIEFWYFPEYAELCRAEISLLKQHSFSRISFLGAGSLPLTAFILARHFPKTPVLCVDYDEEACELSRQLACKIGLAGQIDVQCGDALQYEAAENELTICASLLQGREEVYGRLEKHIHSMIVRDSEGPYQYLYKPAILPDAKFREVSKTSLDARRINTSRYYVHAGNYHLATAA